MSIVSFPVPDTLSEDTVRAIVFPESLGGKVIEPVPFTAKSVPGGRKPESDRLPLEIVWSVFSSREVIAASYWVAMVW